MYLRDRLVRSGRAPADGYGSGLIRGSAVRTVVAYTCFRERDDDPSVTRRLLGMVYWGQHHRGDESYTGFGRFGHEQDPQDPDAIVPFENEKADEIADGLGIPVRDPGYPEQLGTTFLLIDPTVRAPDLVKAIERSWWPALESGVDFNAVVETVEGHESCPRPRKDDVLATFLDAYESATAPPDNRRSDRKQVVLRPIGSFPRPGVLGLVADPAEWSYPEQTEPSGNEVIEPPQSGGPRPEAPHGRGVLRRGTHCPVRARRVRRRRERRRGTPGYRAEGPRRLADDRRRSRTT